MLTERLRLLPVTPHMKVAMQSSRKPFAALVGVKLPENWPEFPEAFRIGNTEPVAPWTGYLFVRRDEPQLIGNGGFVAAPDAGGVVEIGYEIAPAFQNLGFATEAARAMTGHAFASGATAVVAHSLAEPNASNAVMRKLGMRFEADLELEGMRVWPWRIDGRR